MVELKEIAPLEACRSNHFSAAVRSILDTSLSRVCSASTSFRVVFTNSKMFSSARRELPSVEQRSSECLKLFFVRLMTEEVGGDIPSGLQLFVYGHEVWSHGHPTDCFQLTLQGLAADLTEDGVTQGVAARVTLSQQPS